MSKVVVVGSLNMDLVARVAVHPRIGETVEGRDLRYHPGGKGANQAVACARLGARVEMVGRVGADAFGDRLIALQRAEGIDTSHLLRIADAPTGVALIAVASDSSNTIIVTSGANAVWCEGDLDDVPFSPGDILLTQREIPPWLVETALRKARDAGAAAILNPSPVAGFDRALLALGDIVVLNEIELAAIAGVDVSVQDERSVASAAAHLAAAGCRQIVVTLGASGARIFSGNDALSIEGHAVEAIDTTGAGDCFTGALAAALLGGLPLGEAARFANAAACISVTRAGASPAMPTRAEVEAVLVRYHSARTAH